jgi:hypothetical protein
MIGIEVIIQRLACVFRKREHPGVFARTVVVQRARLGVFCAKPSRGSLVKWHVSAALQRRFVQRDFVQY